MAQLHSLLLANHRPYAGVYADATARLAATGFVRALGGGIVAFTSDDLYKKALQLDDASEWVLTATTPTWVQVSGAGSLANDSITNTLLANMAQSTIKGRAVGAGTGDPTDLSSAQATAILDAVVGDSGSGGTKGLVPAPAAGDAAANKFLHADGTYKSPAGSGSIGGSTGATDNAVLRADGTGGATVQSSAVSIDNDGAVTVPEIAAPSTPASGSVVVYAKSDGKLYIKDDAGTETDLTSLSGLITGVIARAPTTLTDAATIATDASLNNKFRVTLGGNRTLGNPTNALDGQSLTWEIIQDGTGSRTLALDTKFVLGTDITDVTLTTTAGKRDFLHVEYNAGADKFYVRAFVKGY